MNIVAVRSMIAAYLAAVLVIFSGLAAAATAPEITAFEAAPVDELTPGTELRFRVTGTPGAQATVRIPGIKQPIQLREMRRGVYEGNYTLKRAEQPTPNAVPRATLRRQNVTVSSRLGTPLAAGTAASAPATPGVQRFTMEPYTIEPGAELTFTLQGTPGGKAAVNLEGTGRAVALTEVQPGVYQGTYTVRRQDRFAPANVIATLQAESRTVRTRLSGQAQQPQAPAITTIEFLTPGDQAQIGTGPVEIRGRSAPNSTFNVHVNTVAAIPALGGARILLARQVQTDSQGYFAFVFDPRDDQRPGTRYEVVVDGVVAGQHKQSRLTLVQG